MNLFSESISIEVSDVHILFGPCRGYMSHEDDFSKDPKKVFYDINDQIENIILMHNTVNNYRKVDEEENK
jgi:hypothetical protein